MSFSAYHTLRLYARWREAYLRAHPEKRLIPLLTEGLGDVPLPEEPIITLGPAGVKIVEETKKWGILAVVAVLLLLASSD